MYAIVCGNSLTANVNQLNPTLLVNSFSVGRIHESWCQKRKSTRANHVHQKPTDALNHQDHYAIKVYM